MPIKGKEFRANQAAETEFAKALRKVARTSHHIVEAHIDGATLKNAPEMQSALKAYSKLIEPWAKRQAARMLERVSKSNRKAFKTSSKEMGNLIRKTVAQREVGEVAAALMGEQVTLIQSIPLRAGIRAQKLALEAIYDGSRAEEIAKELPKNISEAQAMRIARTEVARSNAAITQARATSAGAQWYIWRTTMDGAERESHAEMNGEHIKYSEVPVLSDGTHGHAGMLINCRCWQDVQFDEFSER